MTGQCERGVTEDDKTITQNIVASIYKQLDRVNDGN